MFFSPLILSLLSSSLLPANIYGLSASSGSFGTPYHSNETLGATRSRELVEAYAMLGVPRDNVLALEVDGMRDGMRERWRKDTVVEEVSKAIAGTETWPRTFDYIVTFDQGGVSGHANHRSVAAAADAVGARLGGGRVLRLTSLPLWSKYGGLPYALLRRLKSIASPSTSSRACSFALSSPWEYRRAAKAMQAHASQLVWFRYGWWALSSYVFGAELCEM